MYRLTVSNVNADPRGDSINGIFETIPEVIEHLLKSYNGLNTLTIDARGPNRWDIMIIPIIKTYNFIMEEVSYTELADAKVKELGLDTYDSALPQQWVDDVRAKTGKYPYHVIWGYGARIFGDPVALTPSAQKIIDDYNEARKNG
jgi:hypothetical protein